MAILKDLIVNGASRFIGKVFINRSHIDYINDVAVTETPKFTDTTYESKAAASGGTAVSLVTTGEKYTWNNKTSNTGTVTQVTAGTGLSVGTTAGGNITGTGTLNHTNSVTAQTTQAIYPIKIDAQGHISAYGNAVTPLTASSTLDATKLSGTVPTASLPSVVLTSHQTIKQDGITGATITRFGTCGVGAGTAAKTVSVTAGTFALAAGSKVTVKFTYANTANSPTLNVNSTGAKNIFHQGVQITSGENKSLLAGVVDFVYDGTQWHLIGNYLNTADGATNVVVSATQPTNQKVGDLWFVLK